VDSARAKRTSKLLSLALRHEPAALGLVLDEAGWAEVESVLAAFAGKGEAVTREELEAIVRTSDKQRFALSADGARIRANQGHSIEVDLGLVPREPPERLFHGTVDRFLPSIRAAGLLRGERQHVHLSADRATAMIVARRRKGEPVPLGVRALDMQRDGLRFYLSANGVWLTESVPPRYLEELGG
jgi:putative RNA 2'-phosphotransferase